LFDLIAARMRVLIEEGLSRHDHSIDAVTALCGLLRNERLLQRMRSFGCAEPFERDDLGVADGRNRRDAGADSVTVHQDGAGAALRQSASELRTAQAEVVAYCIEQHAVGLYLDGMIRAVHIEIDFLGHDRLLAGVGPPR